MTANVWTGNNISVYSRLSFVIDWVSFCWCFWPHMDLRPFIRNFRCFRTDNFLSWWQVYGNRRTKLSKHLAAHKQFSIRQCIKKACLILLPTCWHEIQNLSSVLFGNERLVRGFSSQQNIVDGQLVRNTQSICMNAYFCFLLLWCVRAWFTN